MEKWITIYTFNYPHEAYVIRGKLESEGIICFLMDELTIQVDNFYSNALNGVKLQVKTSDVATAIEIMKEGGFHFEDDGNEKILEVDNLPSEERSGMRIIIIICCLVTLIIFLLKILIFGI